MERAAQERHLPFLTAYARMKQQWPIEMAEDDFIETGYPIWREIGNIAPVTQRFFATVPDDFIIELPEDCEFIQSVTQIDDPKVITTFDSGGRKDRHIPSVQVESYTPTRNEPLSANPGESVNYKTLNKNTIEITSPDLLGRDILVVYKSLDVDENGLPKLNDKEVTAIAAEVARQRLNAQLFAVVRDKSSLAQAQLAQLMLQSITAEAGKAMAAAKIDEKITDDALDKMMDIMTSWDRKIFGKRWNPLR